MSFNDLLSKKSLCKEEIIRILEASETESLRLFEKASETKQKFIGNVVHFRGLIELSNVCSKDCYYCGIRKSNSRTARYSLTDDEILGAVDFVIKNNYGSLVLQSGELRHQSFIDRITGLLNKIRERSKIPLGITISFGEQEPETYSEWFSAGATRYLLRIETSNKELYKKLHPNDSHHNFEMRTKCLQSLKSIGYQTGTGIMIGLPFQTLEDIANDILFMQEEGIHMIGLGPYIEHKDTPLYQYCDKKIPLKSRFDLTLKAIAILRILMKDINIAATTALQTIDKMGREKAILYGANILMPNVTPGKYRDLYKLYDNKPCTDEDPEDCIQCLDMRMELIKHKIGYGEKGDSKHFKPKEII